MNTASLVKPTFQPHRPLRRHRLVSPTLNFMRGRVTRVLAGATDGLIAAGRHLLSPLALVEMAAFVGVMALGWDVLAVTIVVWHVLRMGWTALLSRMAPRARTWWRSC